MEKIKEMFKSLKDVFKNLFNNFGITTAIIFLATIVYIFLVLEDVLSDEELWLFRIFAELFALGTFLIETITKKGSKKKIIGTIASFSVASILTYLLVETGYFLDNNINYILRFIILYYIFLIVFIVYFNFKKSNMAFEEYVAKACSNVVKTTVIFTVVAIAFLIFALIFSYFILDGYEYELIVILEMSLTGFYFLPKLLYSLNDVNKEISSFFKFMVKTLLPSLLIIAFAIIYLYIIRILITFDVPSNQIFRVVAGLFVVGLPIWTMATYFKDNTKLYKISENLPFLFIPFIVLQIYAIAVRIIDNGFTEARYLCVMLIIFEIIYIALYFKNKDKIENILIIFLCMSVISLVVPFVNMYKVSFYSQYNNLKIYKEKEILTSEDMQKIKGAYYYLMQNSNNKELIENYLTSEEIEEITNFGIYKYPEEKTEERISVSYDSEVIDVQGYNKIYMDLSSDILFYGIEENIDDIFNNITFKNTSEDYEFSFDLSDTIRSYIEHEEDIDDYFKENNKVIIDENRCFVITDFYIKYNIVNELIENYSIDGYMLEK